MSAPTDPAPGEERRSGRHSAPRTPLLRRPGVIAGAGAVVLLGVVVAGAAALGRPSDEALAGASPSPASSGSAAASTSVSASSSASVSASSPVSSPAAGGGATALSAPVPTTGSPRPTATAASAEALRELAANPRIELSQQARQVLDSRPVDLRLAALLVQLASQQRLSVAEVPAPASGAGDEPARSVVVDRLDGQPVGSAQEAVSLVQRQLAAQDPAYRAEATLQQGQDGAASLLVVLPPVAG